MRSERTVSLVLASIASLVVACAGETQFSGAMQRRSVEQLKTNVQPLSADVSVDTDTALETSLESNDSPRAMDIAFATDRQTRTLTHLTQAAELGDVIETDYQTTTLTRIVTGIDVETQTERTVVTTTDTKTVLLRSSTTSTRVVTTTSTAIDNQVVTNTSTVLQIVEIYTYGSLTPVTTHKGYDDTGAFQYKADLSFAGYVNVGAPAVKPACTLTGPSTVKVKSTFKLTFATNSDAKEAFLDEVGTFNATKESRVLKIPNDQPEVTAPEFAGSATYVTKVWGKRGMERCELKITVTN